MLSDRPDAAQIDPAGLLLKPTELQPHAAECSPDCRDGWIYEGDGARACPACGRARNLAQRVEPGGVVSSVKRRRAAHRAGLASGVKRRQRSHAGRSRKHPNHLGLRLVYEPRLPSRAEFEADYARLWPEPAAARGVAQWRRGRETLWQHLLSTSFKVKHSGQYATTSKPRRAVGLAKRGVRSYSPAVAQAGHGRHKRTIRRLNIKLQQLGYCALIHVPTPRGQRDYLRVEWRLHRAYRVKPPTTDVTHTSGTSNPAFAGVARSPSTAENRLIPPPSAAETENVNTRNRERGSADASRGGADGQDAGREDDRAAAEARLLAKYESVAPGLRALIGRVRAEVPDVHGDVPVGGRGGARRTAGLRADETGLLRDRERPADRYSPRPPGGAMGGDEVDGEGAGRS